MRRPDPRPPVPVDAPQGARWVALTGGAFALVDDGDYDRVMARPWALDRRPKKSYALSNDGAGRNVRMHRFILDAPSDMHVDHRNGDGLDCRRSNMRLCKPRGNLANRRKLTPGTSRFKGVSWDPTRSKWRAVVQVDGKYIHLGRFDSERDAAAAYDAAAVLYFGEFARPNAEGLCNVTS